MKIQNIARKSLIIYLCVFCIMLLFEAARLNPLLEREGAKYTLFLKTKDFLTSLGEQTKIYNLSDYLHETFLNIAENPTLSTNQNLTPKIIAFFSSTKKEEKIHTNPNQELQERTISSENIKQKTTSNQERTTEQHKENTVTNTLEQEQAQTQSVEQTQENQKKQQTENNSKTQEITNTEEATAYTYNNNNFPFQASLITKAQNEESLDQYAVRMPDFGKKKTVLIIGDSMMMEGLGPTLHHRLRNRDNLDVYREGKYSSGLSRPDFYDWPTNLTAMLKKYNPDLLIMSMGANDTQDIVINKKRYFIDTKEWAKIYLQRSKDFIALADNGKRHILWVSLPVMGKEPYFTRTKLISKLQLEASQTVKNASFVNIQHLLTDEKGKYTTFYKDKNNKSIRLRSQDLVHVSNEGGEILTDYVLPSVNSHINSLYAEEMGNIYPPVAGMANHVVFTSSLRQKQVEYMIWLPETNNKLTNQAKSPVDTQKLLAEQLENKRYPVLYLLHGAYGSAEDWNIYIGKKLQEIATQKKVIIVAPSCEPFGWYVDSPLIKNNQIASFLIKELIPHIDSLYPTNKRRAIAGLSMGGHGALLTGFKNQNMFQSMASISGVLDIRTHKNQWKIKELLGEYVPLAKTQDKKTTNTNLEINETQKITEATEQKNTQKTLSKEELEKQAETRKLWDNNAVYALIGIKWPATSPRHIIIVTGDQDTLVLEENRKAQDLLHKRGFKFDYREEQGIHDWNFWKIHIPATLEKQANYLNSLK